MEKIYEWILKGLFEPDIIANDDTPGFIVTSPDDGSYNFDSDLFFIAKVGFQLDIFYGGAIELIRAYKSFLKTISSHITTNIVFYSNIKRKLVVLYE